MLESSSKARRDSIDKLERRLHESGLPNLILASVRTMDQIAIRQVEIAMFLSACAAFERFVHDLDSNNPDAKNAYLNWADIYASDRNSPYHADFRAYWAVRDSIMHGGGFCKYLEWDSEKRHGLSFETKAKLGEWNISCETDLYSDDYANAFNEGEKRLSGIATLWSGVVGWIREYGVSFKK